MKNTKIICSIGPASCDVETMSAMVNNGMNVARINFSHATMEERENVLKTVKEVRNRTGKIVSVLYDTKGPEFRNGLLENGEINLINGKTIKIVKEDVLGNEERFSVNHPSAIDTLNIGNTILLENGLMSMEVISIDKDSNKNIIGVTCKITNGGVLGNRKSLSVPGVHLNMPFISDYDKEDIIYACEHEGDFLALSFVSTKEDVLQVREIIKKCNREDIKIISKIESTTGIDNISEIVSVSDGIMVARGDLGVEAPMEDLPILQQLLIKECRKQGKFCIVATEMLESMKKSPRPTRAEVSDVANAVFNGADAVMLSGETTTGKFPIETVGYMAKICANAEKHLSYSINIEHVSKTIDGAIATNVVETAHLLDAKVIVAATMTGRTARIISNLRPSCQIIATCPSKEVARGLMLNWGVYPSVTDIYDSTDKIVKDAKEKAIKTANLLDDDLIVITAGSLDNDKVVGTNFMKIEKI